ncbi:MAG: hypothetical protein KatS3mg002_0889 [Candidatus Woesearchaeota archaeon]|nr:MAG: hypothetical protein KatS3mg002_0889 [Candidatus Woesearchaeota archaeon]
MSNDKNLIIVATLNDVSAEYLRKDSANPEKLSKGYRIIDNITKSFINDIVRDSNLEIKIETMNEPWVEELIANEYVIFPNDEINKKIIKTRNSRDKEPFSIEPRFIKRYDIISNSLVPISYKNTPLYGFKPRNLEQMLLVDLLLDNDIHIKAVSAEAGTGKSFLQLLVALYKTIERRRNIIKKMQKY